MKNETKKWRLLISLGLLMVVLPPLLKDLNIVEIPDFFKGFVAGCGITLEFAGLFMMKKMHKGAPRC